ncbi:CoA transferase [Streptomyces platensis]|uniref:CoA transferase n=1 Tax=Streptomyces platensis TaxID=58346 RepID=UPI002E13CADF|nr:CoA transferase [Streptomyces platensis]WSI57207.1 CoA transferase [Streptomyces platensis]
MPQPHRPQPRPPADAAPGPPTPPLPVRRPPAPWTASSSRTSAGCWPDRWPPRRSLVNQASGHLATGRDPGPMGNRHPSIAPYETLACRDGQLLAVAVGNDRQFRELARALGAPELAEDLRFARNEDRVQNRTDLIKALEGRLASDTPHGWTERLTAASVPCGPVNTVSEALELAARLGLDPVTSVGEGRVPQVTSPLRLSGTPVAQPFAPPRLDEHGTALRTWLSGPSDDPLPPRM